MRIWRDAWIPRPPSLKISMKKGRSRVRWVSQLMKQDSREWDVNMLEACLFQHDIDEVMKIRLSDRVQEDYVAWHYEKSGLFTVRSAYHLAVRLDQQEHREVGSSSHADGSRRLYNKIWSSPVPQKVSLCMAPITGWTCHTA